MSKYIKARGRIYKVVIIDLEGNVDENERRILVEVAHHCEWYLPKEDIIKEADDIKDLIDCIVVDYGHYKHFTTQPINNALVNIVNTDFTMRSIKAGTIKVYGAIWTEWGLKYVAKINEEGELELLL